MFQNCIILAYDSSDVRYHLKFMFLFGKKDCFSFVREVCWQFRQHFKFEFKIPANLSFVAARRKC